MVSRRHLLQTAATLPLVLGGSAGAAELRLRMFWWGGQERARRTIAVNDLYHQHHPDVTIAGESQDGAAYFQKLATQLAGRDAPDIFQLEPTALPDFASRGATLPLDPMLGKDIQTKDFAPGMLDLCRIDGKVQGLPIGVNSFSLFIDNAAFSDAGFTPPNDATTWDQYADLCVAFTKKVAKPNYWASPDGSRYHDMFRVWLGQRGKVLFTADGQLGCNADDAAEWFAYWDKLRKAGGITPPDVASLDSMLVSTYPMPLGKSPVCIAWSNQLV
ncbi:MAG TPA: extracellular solute-binding protein, partial [Acetobacteraceae bacterium]|nr:extracellular solute-binding protein [Acetobacteraceae bacterium]